MLPYLALLRWPLLWTVVISIGAGYLPNLDSTFSLSRTLGLLPFFTLGWWLREHDVVERFRLLRRRAWWVPVAAVAAFAVAGWAAWFFVDGWREMNLREWLFYDENYSSLGGTAVVGGRRAAGAHGHRDRAQRGVLRAAAAPHALVDALRPVHDVRLPAALVRAVPVPRVRALLRDLEPTWLWLPIVIVASVLIALGLATKPVRRVFRPLVEPRPAWLFADPTLARREGRRSDPTGSRRPPEQPRGRGAHPDPRQNG